MDADETMEWRLGMLRMLKRLWFALAAVCVALCVIMPLETGWLSLAPCISCGFTVVLSGCVIRFCDWYLATNESRSSRSS